MSASNFSSESIISSSHSQNWSGVYLEHCLYPAYETSEYVLPDHHICLYVGNPLIYEQVVKGKLRSHNCIYGDLVLYPAGLSQKLSWNQEAEIIQLDIKPELIAQASQESVSASRIELIPQYGIRDPLIQQLALTLLAELRDGSNNSLYTDSLLNTLCLHLVRHYSNSKIIINHHSDGLSLVLRRRLDEYIQANLAQNITLVDIAREIGMSVSHLTKLFKQSQGISLHQYVIRCRIERAKQLLKLKHLAIAEISMQVGFADQSHFTRNFKKYVGITPKVFQQF